MAELDVIAESAKIAERVDLALDGRLYANWTAVSIMRSLDALSGRFQLILSAKEASAGADIAVKPGDRCKVLIGGEPVIDGWVDSIEPSIERQDRSIAINGRDRTADLADCSAIHKPGSWSNVRLEAIAAELARPFGIAVTARTPTGQAITRFALQQGETVQAAIERLLRFRGLLMVADSGGNLDIITPADGPPIATLEDGVNILAATARFDHSERFGTYLIKGQASGNDTRNGKTVSQIRGEATDAAVTRHRPLLIVAEDQGDGASLATRAEWEAGVRAGRATVVEISALGWRVSPGGALWAPNTRVRVRSAFMRLPDQAMLVTAVTYVRDENGTIATMTLMPPGAWRQLAVPEARA